MLAPNLIEIDDARLHLRADDTDSDEWFHLWIPVVSQAILSWLGDTWRLYELQRDSKDKIVTDENGVPIPMRHPDGRPIIHLLVRGAALIELAEIYTKREGEGRSYVTQAGNSGGAWGYTLSAGATALLQGLRKSTVA